LKWVILYFPFRSEEPPPEPVRISQKSPHHFFRDSFFPFALARRILEQASCLDFFFNAAALRFILFTLISHPCYATPRRPSPSRFLLLPLPSKRWLTIRPLTHEIDRPEKLNNLPISAQIFHPFLLFPGLEYLVRRFYKPFRSHSLLSVRPGMVPPLGLKPRVGYSLTIYFVFVSPSLPPQCSFFPIGFPPTLNHPSDRYNYPDVDPSHPIAPRAY